MVTISPDDVFNDYDVFGITFEDGISEAMLYCQSDLKDIFNPNKIFFEIADVIRKKDWIQLKSKLIELEKLIGVTITYDSVESEMCNLALYEGQKTFSLGGEVDVIITEKNYAIGFSLQDAGINEKYLVRWLKLLNLTDKLERTQPLGKKYSVDNVKTIFLNFSKILGFVDINLYEHCKQTDWNKIVENVNSAFDNIERIFNIPNDCYFFYKSGKKWDHLIKNVELSDDDIKSLKESMSKIEKLTKRDWKTEYPDIGDDAIGKIGKAYKELSEMFKV